MHKFFGRLAASVAMAGAVVVMSGCDNDNNDRYESRQQQYVAPTKPYAIVDNADLGIKYAVLQEGSLITSNISGWHALSPELFTMLSGLTVAAPEPDKTYYPGQGFVIPAITAGPGKPENKMATISGGLVPKQLSGWVAVDQANLEKLTEKYFKANEPKTPAPTTPAPTTPATPTK